MRERRNERIRDVQDSRHILSAASRSSSTLDACGLAGAEHFAAVPGWWSELVKMATLLGTNEGAQRNFYLGWRFAFSLCRRNSFRQWRLELYCFLFWGGLEGALGCPICSGNDRRAIEARLANTSYEPVHGPSAVSHRCSVFHAEHDVHLLRCAGDRGAAPFGCV